MRHIGNRRLYSDATPMMLMDGRGGNSNGRRNGNDNGWRNNEGHKRRDGEAMANKLMDTVTATLMDGATATRWRQKAGWRRDGDNVDGLHGCNGDGWSDGNVNGWRNAKVMVMMLMDGATATAIARRQWRWMA